MENLPLKDIHLPDPVSVWPLAPGWWILLALIVLLPVAVWYAYRVITRRTAAKTAKRLLATIRDDASLDDRQRLTALSALLRRVAISTEPRVDVASLRGEDWLRHLDASLTDQPFSQGIGRCLADAHFRETLPSSTEFAALYDLCERWLKRQGKRK